MNQQLLDQGIEFTPVAVEQLATLVKGMRDEKNDEVDVRIYVINPLNKDAETCLAYCFAEDKRDNPDDLIFKFSNFNLYIEKDSMPILKQTKIDLLNNEITIVSPNIKGKENKSQDTKSINIKHSLEVKLIPTCEIKVLKEGTPIRVMQVLGDNVTLSFNGVLGFVSVEDFKTLNTGYELDTSAKQEILLDANLYDQIWHSLKSCYDPEIPVNVVDLGLIYDLKINPTQQDKTKFCVIVTMTLTNPACNMGDFIAQQMRDKVNQIDNIIDTQIEITFEPLWNQSMMSEEAKLELGLI